MPNSVPSTSNSLYIVTPSPYARDALANATPVSPQIWNFTPVESIVALAGHYDTRRYCPDTRRYYPDAQSCPSPWLNVIP